MKKMRIIFCLVILELFNIRVVNATNNSLEKQMEETLAKAYGAPVEVNIGKDKCEINYSKIEVVEEKKQVVADETSQNKYRIDKNIEISYIPESKAVCSKVNDFDNMDQYLIKDILPQKFLAQMYNSYHFPVLRDINIKEFEGVATVVPQIGLISYEKYHIGNAIYDEIDKVTGESEEKISIQRLKMERAVNKQGEKIFYNNETYINMFDCSLPFLDLQLHSGYNKVNIEYEVSPDIEFNYDTPEQNFESIVFSKSETNNFKIKFDISILDTIILFDLKSNNYMRRSSKDYIDIFGETVFTNIDLQGKWLENTKGLLKKVKDFSVRYALKNVSMKHILQAKDLLQNAPVVVDRAYEHKRAEIVDALIDKIKLSMKLRWTVTDGEVIMNFNLQKKNGYLVGTNKIEVKNLYQIFSEQKQCFNNPNASQLPECADNKLFSILKNYIDLNKNDSVTTINISEKGVFIGREKIGEPIKINILEMLINKELEEQPNFQMIEKYDSL